MAQILPDNPPRRMPAEVLRAFNALKALPEEYYIWHHLAPWQPDVPDFLLIAPDSRALLIKVCSASAVQATPAAQMLLLDDAPRPIGEAEEEIVRRFTQSLDLPWDHSLSNLILFPNISHRQMLYSRPSESNDNRLAGPAKSCCKKTGICIGRITCPSIRWTRCSSKSCARLSHPKWWSRKT